MPRWKKIQRKRYRSFLCVNAEPAGGKEQPVEIGKPRCFKGLKDLKKPTGINKKDWMNIKTRCSLEHCTLHADGARLHFWSTKW